MYSFIHVFQIVFPTLLAVVSEKDQRRPSLFDDAFISRHIDTHPHRHTHTQTHTLAHTDTHTNTH